MHAMRSERPKKIAFLDRDGVINQKAASHEYVTSSEKFIFNEGIFLLLYTLQNQGYQFIVVTNQRGVARKMLTHTNLEEIHTKMRTGLREHGIEILDIFFCPHETDSCECRKPKPGLLQQATKKHSIDLSQSILISDSEDDVTMGQNFGLKQSILVPHDVPEKALEHLEKIRIAFIKFGGLASGGSEKMLQIIAANLDKSIFDVTYYYCDSAPYIGDHKYTHPGTDTDRLEYMKQHNIRLVEFHVGAKDITTPTHIWRDTNFWEKFDQDKYDLIQTTRAGHKEYPFTLIRKTPILEILGLQAGCDNQFNIARTLHVSKENMHAWIRTGGDKERARLVSLPIEISDTGVEDLRKELGLASDVFVYGMHQRVSDDIFSPIPLLAYKKIESAQTAFVLMGGSQKYREQAEILGLKNIHIIPPSGNTTAIERFLKTLNVFAHGRLDGEVNSQAIAEALFFGLPIVSHTSAINNGHIEGIADAGRVLPREDATEYAMELEKLHKNHSYYRMRSIAARERFLEHYDLSHQIGIFEDLYREVVRNPFPHPIRRLLFGMHWTQNLRIWVKWLYLKMGYLISGRI